MDSKTATAKGIDAEAWRLSWEYLCDLHAGRKVPLWFRWWWWRWNHRRFMAAEFGRYMKESAKIGGAP